MPVSVTNGAHHEITYGTAVLIGPSNEDALNITLGPYSSFAVYDGHNGNKAARLAANHLHSTVMDHLDRVTSFDRSLVREGGHPESLSVSEQMDALFCHSLNEAIHDTHTQVISNSDSGTTMTGLFIRREAGNNKGGKFRLIFSNIGDSRSVMLTCTKATSLGGSSASNSQHNHSQSNHLFAGKPYGIGSSLHGLHSHLVDGLGASLHDLTAPRKRSNSTHCDDFDVKDVREDQDAEDFEGDDLQRSGLGRSAVKVVALLTVMTEDHHPLYNHREVERINKQYKIAPMSMPIDIDYMDGSEGYISAVNNAIAEKLPILGPDCLVQASTLGWCSESTPVEDSTKERYLRARSAGALPDIIIPNHRGVLSPHGSYFNKGKEGPVEDGEDGVNRMQIIFSTSSPIAPSWDTEQLLKMKLAEDFIAKLGSIDVSERVKLLKTKLADFIKELKSIDVSESVKTALDKKLADDEKRKSSSKDHDDDGLVRDFEDVFIGEEFKEEINNNDDDRDVEDDEKSTINAESFNAQQLDQLKLTLVQLTRQLHRLHGGATPFVDNAEEIKALYSQLEVLQYQLLNDPDLDPDEPDPTSSPVCDTDIRAAESTLQHVLPSTSDDDQLVPFLRSPAQKEKEIQSIMDQLRDGKIPERTQSFIAKRENVHRQAVGPLALFGRWGRSLLMTRSIGDRWNSDKAVAVADITATTVFPDQFARLVIASDGVWDVIDNDTVRRYGMYYAYKEPKDFASFLAVKARRRREKYLLKIDDITVIVVDVNPQNAIFLETKYSRLGEAKRGITAKALQIEEAKNGTTAKTLKKGSIYSRLFG
jgi:serine/threonine protein phosphatase PrpC